MEKGKGTSCLTSLLMLLVLNILIDSSKKLYRKVEKKTS